jgi:hypothetical protein
MAEERRLGRAFRRVLGLAPDATLIARGRGRAAGLSLTTGKIATAWNGGGWCLVYPLEELIGAELSFDGEVVGRVLRGEPRRALERGAAAASEVSLRLLFDDPLNPDFELQLWPPAKPSKGAPTRVAEAISEANRWLGRIEAVLRRTGVAVVRPEPAPRPAPIRRAPEAAPDLFEADEEDPPF